MASTPPSASSFPQIHSEIEMENLFSSPATRVDAYSASSTVADPINSSSGDNRYDVFINHRGPDTKKTFASHLYRRLFLHGFRTFLDQKELQEGLSFPSQIADAIGTASVHVAVFSPKYTESKWCLDELLLMRESGAPIIPVFYHVEPAKLRYGEALHKLQTKTTYDPQTRTTQQRYDSATLQNWRDALSRVADTSGFDLDGAFNGDEGQMLDEVIQRVVKILAKKTRLYVANYPTGLDEKVKDFETTVKRQQHTGKVQVVGIVGYGGVGKTTLALEFFNRNCSQYNKSYFLSDVRENAKSSSHLLQLQRELLKGLTQSDRHVDNIHQGTQMLKDFLSTSQVLLILDDIDHEDQVDKLLPERDSYCSNSLILITSRDGNVLKRSRLEESSIYKLTGLSAQHSRELFCSYAFCQSYPLQGFEDLVDKFLMACDGLPLSLKVFGGLLFGKKDKSSWEDTLYQVHEVPNDILERLRISYDALYEEEQQIFLDIACFFIGENRDMATKVWDGSGWKGLLGFQNLQSKCLVEVDSNNCIRMHDQLRDMGRKIALDKLPRRLWRPTENIDDILQQSSAITEVRGITMFPNTDSDGDEETLSLYQYSRSRELLGNCVLFGNCVTRRQWRPIQKFDDLLQQSSVMTEVRGNVPNTDSDGDDETLLYQARSQELFGNCMLLGNCVMKLCNILHNTWYRFLGIGVKKLQLVETEGHLLERILRMVHFPNLIWLSWRDCPYSYLPSWIPMKNLRVLKVEGRVFKTLWLGRSQAPIQLRVLEISGPLSNISESIAQLKHLERIVFEYVDLEKLPHEFYHLRSLKDFVLRRCSNLKALPESFGNLTNLQLVGLFQCWNLETLPQSFGNLRILQHIELSECWRLETLPDSFGNLRTLQHIKLSGCMSLKKLPDSLDNLGSLQHIELSECGNLEELPYSFGSLRNLQHIELYGCGSLKTLPDSFGCLRTLQHIKLCGCGSLEKLPDSFGNLGNLRHIKLSGCKGLKRLPDSFGNLRNLQHIKLSDCSFERLPDSFGNLTNLQHIELFGCRSWKRLPDSFVNLRKVQHINLSECQRLERLPDLFGNLTSLQYIELSKCGSLQMLPNSFGNLRNLQHIKLYRCDNLQRLPDSFGNLINLKHITLFGCDNLERLPASFGNLMDLQHIKLSCCRSLDSLPDSFGNLRNVQHINLSQCWRLERLPDSFGNLRNVQHINLSQCRRLERLPESFGNLMNLQHIKLSECKNLQTLPNSFSNLRNLQHLDLYLCENLYRLPDSFGNLMNLQYVSLLDCKNLQGLPSIKSLIYLEHLNASFCTKLKSIPDLAHLANLKLLDVSGCIALEQLDGVEHCTSLDNLDAVNCPNLKFGGGVVKKLRQQNTVARII